VSVVLELCEKFGNTGVNKKIHATCEAPTKITLTVQNKTYCYYYIIIINCHLCGTNRIVAANA